MAGESIEDLRIDMYKLSDAELKKRYFYCATEDNLKNVLEPVTLKFVVSDIDIGELLQKEYE
jgi:hypothetical protein